MRRADRIESLLLASIVGLCAARGVACADDDHWTLTPSIQIGGHAETGRGVLPGLGLDKKEHGGGVAAAFSLMGPVRPRVYAGLAFELTGARVDVDPQVYGVASIRGMTRAEYYSRPAVPWTPNPRTYLVLGAGWNFNSPGTKISYPLGALLGRLEELTLDDGLAFEGGAGIEWSHNRELDFNAEVTWVRDTARYHLQVSGEPDRVGDSDLSGLTIVLGVRLHPSLSPEGPGEP